jgi:cell division protease FtsH
MAEALILYETISSDQIDDIMEGREPREPDDWSDDDQNQATVEKEKSRPSSAGTGPIGGPAGEH